MSTFLSAPNPQKTTSKTSYAGIAIGLIACLFWFSSLPKEGSEVLAELHQLQASVVPAPQTSDDFARVAKLLENPTQLLTLEDRGAVERVARASGKRSELGKLLATLLSGKFADGTTTHLRLLTTDIGLPASDGTTTIAGASSVFKSYIDSDFKAWGLDVPGAPTPAGKASVYEMKKDGSFVELFGSLGRPLDDLVMTQAQVIEFCKTHPELLRQDGFATFFLLKRGEEFFVADVDLYSDALYVYVYRFEYDCVWDAGSARRLVVPQ